MDRKCSICRDLVTRLGRHFSGKPSCGSCRVFFHRNAHRFEELHCYNSDNCKINSIETRNKCQKCRLHRCFEIGMQLKSKLKLINFQTNSLPIPKSSNLCTIPLTLRGFLEEKLPDDQNFELIHRDFINVKTPKPKSLDLNPYEQSQLCELNQFMSDSFAEENNLELVEGEIEHLVYISTMSCVYARSIVRYCKKFDFFRSLPKEEQLRMLKSFAHRVIALRMGFQYSDENHPVRMMATESGSHSILVRRHSSMNKNSKRTANHHRKLRRLKRKLEDDPNIRNLLTAILLTNPQDENVYELPPVVRFHYFYYSHLLVRYLESKHRRAFLAEHKYKSIVKGFFRGMNSMNSIIRNRIMHIDNLADFTAEALGLK